MHDQRHRLQLDEVGLARRADDRADVRLDQSQQRGVGDVAGRDYQQPTTRTARSPLAWTSLNGRDLRDGPHELHTSHVVARRWRQVSSGRAGPDHGTAINDSSKGALTCYENQRTSLSVISSSGQAQAACAGGRDRLYSRAVPSREDPERGDVDGGRPLVVAPRLEYLPLNELSWERYELLLRRIAQQERGLRRVRLYGSPGQSQYGIDLAGQAPDGTGEAIQSKRYVTFTPADLTAAVAKFIESRSEIPFPVDRLFIAAACVADRRQVTDELYRLAVAHPEVEVEFWDRRTQCDILRRRRDIVAEFFGDQAVDAFCYPAPLDVVPISPPDRVELADALLRGPAEITGARTQIARADRLQLDEPEGAAEAVQDAIELLRGGGFAAHAAVLVPHRAELLGRAGRHDDGVHLLSEEFWRAVDIHDNDEAGALLRAMRAHELSTTTEKLVSIADHTLTVLRDPLGLPNIALDDWAEDSVTVELARLALLMAQTSAIDPGCTWTADHAERLTALADQVEGNNNNTDDDRSDLAIGIRIEVADATAEWANLVTAARRSRLLRSVAARVLARYGMHVAERGGCDEADQAWADATEQGCLAGDHAHAAEWVHARRVLSSRHQGINSEFEDSHRLVRALYAISGGPPRQQQRLKERALRALVDGKPHVAVPALRSLLRLAYVDGCWGEVLDARGLLANAYRVGTELELAVALLVAAGRASSAEDMAKEAGDTYLDLRHHLRHSPAYWVPATALRVIAAQADIVPDEHMEEIVDAAVDVLERHRAGTLRDTPLLSPSVLLAALRALAALAQRLSETAAASVLDYLKPLVPRDQNSYRHTDDSHVRVCVGIAGIHASLRAAALGQLLDLLAAADSGVSERVEHEAADLFIRFRPLVEDRLRELSAAGNTYATALLTLGGGTPDGAQMTAAAAALAAPLRNTATSIGVGTGAVRQSQLAWHLPDTDRRDLVAIQLDRAAFPYEPAHNRADYLLAAVNLSHDLDSVDDLYRRAVAAADDANPSLGDLMVNIGNHPLGTFRTSGATLDTRPHAVYLASALARTPDQKAEVRARALALLGTPSAGYYVVRALQKLAPTALAHDVPLLATQADWAVRSLAALTWAIRSPDDPTIGLLLAEDNDVRVRRALASAVSNADKTTVTTAVETTLRTDRHFSVRSLLA